MIKVIVTSPDFREMRGVGKPYHMRFQTGHAYTVDKEGTLSEFPDNFEITLEDSQAPYPRGA